MVDTGLYARWIFAFIKPKLCQSLHWRRTSPASSNDSPWSYLSPISQHFARHARIREANLDALVPVACCSRPISIAFPYAVPRRKHMGNWRWGLGNGWIGCLLPVSPWPLPSILARYVGRYSLRPASRFMLQFINTLISRVTTPAPMGAFFRNEGGRNTPSLPRMEEGTQGVSLSFKEEVACGSGWFPASG